jgi:hypothetical protein
MKKWLKENWFKLGILVAIFVAVVLFFGNNNAYQNSQITVAGDANIQSSSTASTTNSSTLENIQPSLQGNNQENTDYSALVTEWQNQVAQVICTWDYSNGTPYETDEASALLAYVTGLGNVAVTNHHVIADSNGNSPNTCTVGVYGMGSRTVQYRQALNPFLKNKAGYDFAFIQLDDKFLASKTGSDIFSTDPSANPAGKVCPNGDALVGDKLIVLGYPAIGTVGGITVTEGIVSGIETDDYVTSAKIDHGNSGGAAVLVKDDCYLGIPTWVANNGGFESLGRILKGTLEFSSG